jgi:DNA replication licensing factor MCM6
MFEFEKTQFQQENNSHEDNSRETYECSFDNGYDEGLKDSVRGLKCHYLGKLIKLKGTVTRTSEVRPELKTGYFKCRTCGKLSKPIVQQFKYTEPKRCSTENCDRSSWELEMSKCTFADFQKIRVQEDPTKIPPGAMPRSIDVILRNEFTERGQPGDIC